MNSICHIWVIFLVGRMMPAIGGKRGFCYVDSRLTREFDFSSCFVFLGLQDKMIFSGSAFVLLKRRIPLLSFRRTWSGMVCNSGLQRRINVEAWGAKNRFKAERHKSLAVLSNACTNFFAMEHAKKGNSPRYEVDCLFFVAPSAYRYAENLNFKTRILRWLSKSAKNS